MDRTRVFALPFAGGNSYCYRALQSHFAAHVDLVPLEPPGRGKRFKDPLLRDLLEISQDLFNQMVSQLTPRYAIYGHSMGTLTGYLLSHMLIDRGYSAPCHLIVSGHAGPSKPITTRRYTLGQSDFFNMLRDLGGCPPEVLAQRELMELMEPILRADFQAIEQYQYQTRDPLPCPITCLLGDDDKVTQESGQLWQKETQHPLTIHNMSGGHFFIYDHAAKVAQIINEAVK